MKNLFDFATKELSQDAFIRWLLENYDDPKLSEYSKSFLRFLVGDKNYEFDHLETFAQVDKIDVSVDIYKDKKSTIHDVLVIEDKTGSSEHNQLNDYDTAISKWKNVEKVYRVFYKTNPLSEQDEKGIAEANLELSNDCKWVVKSLDDIYGHFNGKATSKSQIYNDYVEHVEKIHRAYNEISKETADKWTSINWSTFFLGYMKKYHPDTKCYTTNYRGMYESLILNFYIPKTRAKYLACATFEIIVRSKLKPYLHPSFKIIDNENKEKWYWSINGVREDVKEQCEKELLELREHVQNRNSKLLVRGNTARSFANITEDDIDYKNKTADEVWREMDKWIKEYISAIDSFVKRK